MQILIKDILRLKPLQGLKLLTKPGGLDNAVSKVGTLEYELTMQGRAFCSEEHWERGEFVLTTFQYARENPQLITGAVKKMVQAHTSGMAVKNVYQLEIPKEAIQYANTHDFPIFTFTDHDLYFEDVILAVHQLLQSQRDQEFLEESIAALLFRSCNSQDIENRAREIVPFLSNKYQVVYCIGREGARLPIVADSSLRLHECSIIRYRSGWFLFINQPTSARNLEFYLKQFAIPAADYWIGISEIFYFKNRLKKGILQAMYAARYSQMMDVFSAGYRDLGFYQFLLPHSNDEWLDHYFEQTISVIQEADLASSGNLMETALLYEKTEGNLKEMAAEADTHVNTVRYRLKKLAELFDRDPGNVEFLTRLLVAVRIYRVKQFCEQVGELI